MRTFRLVRRFMRGQRRTFLMALLMLVFEAATAVFEAYPLAYLIDYLRGDRAELDLFFINSGLGSTVAVLGIAIVLIAMVNSAADSLGEIFLARGGQALGYELRVELFGHLQRLSLAYHDRRRTGDVITRVTGDVKELEEFVTDSVSDLIGSVFLLAGVLAFLLFNSWQVTLVGVLMIPVLAYISNYFSRRIKEAARKQRAREGDLASTTQEMLTSIRVVQTFGRTERAERRFAVESGQAMDAGLETARLEAWFSWIWSALKALAIALVVWIGLFVVPRDALPLGILVMCVLLIDQMFKPTRKIIKEWNKIGKLFASVERIAEVLDREPAVKDQPGAIVAPRLRGHIEFRNVSFAYKLDPEDLGDVATSGSEVRQALSDVSFTVAPGEVVALVGHSGAGKSTIAQLLPRLYDPQEGKVLLDGRDVRTFTLESLRSEISVVLQETVLFSGTVADNIAYGREGATREEVLAAAKQANAHEFIEQMPNGYDTELSERASNLSGGQRQRIAIARALIRGTPILILDEPTTGLDAESTDVVLGALKTLMRGKTTLLLSHDLGLIRSADRILVLRAGEIEQRGTHDQLLREGGLYAYLYAKQFSEDEQRRTGREETVDSSPAAHSFDDLIDRKPSGPTAEKGPSPRAVMDDHVSETIVDPLKSPGLRRELPGLEIALDDDAMREQLQDALIGAEIGGSIVGRCSVGKLSYLPDEGCLIRYRIELTDRDDRARRALVGGRLLKSPAAADAFARTRLQPLAVQARDRDEAAPFVTPVAVLRALPLAVHVFPIDPELPTLVAATDANHMLDVVRPLMRPAFGEAEGAMDCRVELAHYPRRGRCTLRYELHDPSGVQRRIPSVAYGKITRNGRPRTGAVLSVLHRHVIANGDRPCFVVPRFLGLRPELSLSLVEAIPGRPRVGDLVKARTADEEPDMNLEDAVDACALIAGTLHDSSLDVGSGRTISDDLEDLGPQLESVRRAAPDLCATLDASAAAVALFAATCTPLSARPCHGDYTHSQVVFDESGRPGLLDFDTMCVAEPALDLGQFCAYLRVACRKAERATPSRTHLGDELCERFLSSYLEARRGSVQRERLLTRVAAYEATSLLRMTLHSWHQLKAARTGDAVTVLRERMAWLGASVR